MSLTVEQRTALEVLIARFEGMAGRACSLADHLVLSYAAQHLAAGRCVGLRVAPGGCVLVELYRMKGGAS